MIVIELNGVPRDVDEGGNVYDLIVALDLADQALAVAVNREIVPRHLWPQRLLHSRDRIDIVRAIGGG